MAIAAKRGLGRVPHSQVGGSLPSDYSYLGLIGLAAMAGIVSSRYVCAYIHDIPKSLLMGPIFSHLQRL